MRLLQVGGSLAVEAGGLAAACASLANHLARAGAQVTAVVVRAADDAEQWPLDRSVTPIMCAPLPPRRLGFCPALRAQLATAPPADVVHLHGLWRLHYAQVARAAKRAGTPMIVSTHGMLHAPALRQRAGLKRIAASLFQDSVLERAVCLHATAQAEVDEIRRFGYRGPVALVPWGVEAPAACTDRASAPRDRRERLAVYLGRLHPSKGLDLLLGAWARIAADRPAWRLLVAGYDEAGYRASLEALSRALAIGDRVTFRDPVSGAAREALFASAELVVLPSPAENFGFVVPEALVRGVPVVATTGTPWSALAAERCGWSVAPTADALADALAEATGEPADALQAMGERGRRFARSRFDWHVVARRLMDLYAWAQGRAGRPEDVQVAA